MTNKLQSPGGQNDILLIYFSELDQCLTHKQFCFKTGKTKQNKTKAKQTKNLKLKESLTRTSLG